MSMLINISEGSSLAMHGLALIAINNPKRLNIKYLAKKLKASEAHLAKVFQQLSKSGIVKSLRGPSGGFVLNKPANKINLLEIHEIIDGKVDINTCPLGKNNCPFSDCNLYNDLFSISKNTREVFKNMKLSKFINKNKQ
ncbi:MAG: Rrf2 family transcriptional regulator [Candidatus Marinimicrobia bacterium]|nr:Rrf2 family transcriptional regulator [Candidatus Neomarinimicrobiota bacterium]